MEITVKNQSGHTSGIRGALRELLGIEPQRLPAVPPLVPPDAVIPGGSLVAPDSGAVVPEQAEGPRADAPQEGSAEQQQIAGLRQRVAELETLNARLRAGATRTLPREDPSNREIHRQGNAAAYENDMQNLKTT